MASLWKSEIRGFLNELAKNGKDFFTFRDFELAI